MQFGCGYFGCSRSKNKHALQHWQSVERNEEFPHCLWLNLDTMSIWCLACQIEINN